ncbi:MAG: glycosyltransferase [uncultured bacterium]|nr:MAG: glycosyltransferase [uncultured bacterium]HBD05064.1 hypothetical protein [Candidatus Uhrbacteria bacterium]
MKICIISNLYPPIFRGGAERIVERIVNELVVRGHDVFVISTKPWSGLASLHAHETEKPAERVYRFYPLNLYHLLNDSKHIWPVRFLWHVFDAINLHSALEVKRILEQEKPDIVFTHNLKGIGLLIPLAIRRVGIKHAHTLHDVQLVIPSGLLFFTKKHTSPFTRAGHFVYEQVCRILFGSPDIVISPSKFLLDFYLKKRFFKKSKTSIYPNPAPHAVPLVRTSRQDGPLRLLFAGQLETHKGPGFLAKSLRSLQHPYELHIAGEGSLLDEVLNIASENDNIKVHGFVSTDQLMNLFHDMDALVVPSLCFENSPTVIYESLWAGVPVVASDIGGVGELVHDGTNGYLFTPADERSLLSALDRLFENKERFYASQSEIQKTVVDYSIERYVDKLIAVAFV